MRVNSINSASYPHVTFQGDNRFKNNVGKTTDKVDTFEAETKTKKASFLDKLRAFLLLEEDEPTEEDIKSEEIKDLLGDLYDESDEIKKFGKYYAKFLKYYYSLGAANNFKAYTPDEANGRKLLFDFDDEDKTTPTAITVIEINNGFKVLERYEFEKGLKGPFTVEDNYLPEATAVYIVDKKKVTYCSETDRETKVKQIIMPFDKGFYYAETKPDENGEDVILTEAYIDDKHPEASRYAETDENGAVCEYFFDEEIDTWVKKENSEE